MILVRAPLRITLGGGGTDLPVWYKKNKSFLIYLAINKYIYVSINKRNYDNKIWLSYSKIEVVNKINEIKNEYIKVCFKRFKNLEGIEFHSIAEIPSSSGLGSSGSFLVANNFILNDFKNIIMSKNSLAELSCKQEMINLGKSTGKQDQYAATFGGFQKMKIDKKGKVSLQKIHIKQSNFDILKKNILLYYTNIFRSSDSVLKRQTRNIKKNKNTLAYMNEIQNLGHLSYDALVNEDYDEFGRILNAHYNFKRKISSLMSNNILDKIYEYSIESGAIGGKIIGAGGGGVFMFYVPLRNQKKFRNKIVKTGMREISWDIDNYGVKKIFG